MLTFGEKYKLRIVLSMIARGSKCDVVLGFGIIGIFHQFDDRHSVIADELASQRFHDPGSRAQG